MSRFNRPSKTVLIVSIFGIVLFVFFVKKAFDRYLNGRLVEGAQSICKTCEMSLGSSEFSMWGGGILLREVVFKGGDPSISRVELNAKEIRSDVSPFSFLKDELDLGKISILEPSVVLVDGDSHSPPSSKTKDKNESQKVLIQGISIKGGSFKYVRSSRGDLSSLQFNEIDAQVGSLGNSREQIEKVTQGSAQTKLGNSGSIHLEVSANPFSENLVVDVLVKVKDQDLAAMTTFLTDNDGISIKGQLEVAEGKVHLVKNKAEAKVFAKYKNFDMSFDKTKTRSGFMGFLMNLGEFVLLDNDNQDEARIDQVKSVSVSREAQESVVSFILRGLKEAALSVASSAKTQKPKPFDKRKLSH